jgi:aryl-alcohol dehydrogenase-like predicted oxidoreductase
MATRRTLGTEGIELSRVGLGVAAIDIYLLHWPDETGVPLEDTWVAMRALVDDGLVRAVGLSNFTIDDVQRCVAIGPVDLVQEGLSPIDHLDNRRLLQWCEDHDIGAVTYEPLGNGMLAGAISGPTDFARVVDDYEEWGFWKLLFAPGKFERSELVASGMSDIATQLGCSLAQLALAWNLHQVGVTATLAGSRNPFHVRENCEAAAIELTPAVVAQIEALIPLGPTFS